MVSEITREELQPLRAPELVTGGNRRDIHGVFDRQGLYEGIRLWGVAHQNVEGHIRRHHPQDIEDHKARDIGLNAGRERGELGQAKEECAEPLDAVAGEVIIRRARERAREFYF